MASEDPPVERLRDYLKSLKPEARAMLVAELERATLRGEENAGNALVLQELRRAIRGEGQPVGRVGDAARMFFTPLEPFLIDDPADHKRVGRLSRRSLTPIWEWIGRDLMPAPAKALSDDINRALLDGDRQKAEQLTRTLHERAVLRIRETIAAVSGEEKARRRLAVEVGTPRALDDLAALAGILANRDQLAELARRLPLPVRSLEPELADAVRALIETAPAQKQPAGGAGKADLYLYGFLLVMSRLASPWQLIRIATRAADSDDAQRIADNPCGIAVEIVLSEAECMVGELRTELRGHRPVTSQLKAIHDAVRGLRTELDLSGDSPWSRRVVAIRTDVSNILKAEIESAPGRTRRLLRPRPVKEIAPGSVLNAIDVNDVETLIEFVATCRNYAGELAVNEVTMRSFSELQNYLETGTRVLLDALRLAGDADRPFRQSQLDAAIRFCRIVFGADYAGLVAKAAEIATQSAAAERKQVRA